MLWHVPLTSTLDSYRDSRTALAVLVKTPWSVFVRFWSWASVQCQRQRHNRNEGLALRELRRSARPLQARLLSLFDTRIAAEESRTFQIGTEIRVEEQECPADAVANRIGLAFFAAAGDVRFDIDGLGDPRECQGSRSILNRIAGEVLLQLHTVDRDLTGTFLVQLHARAGGLALSETGEIRTGSSHKRMVARVWNPRAGITQ